MMDDLISRISLKQSIVLSMILGGEKTLDQIIDEEPSIDAVPVVRCKDCKYWHREIYNGIEYFNFSSCDLNHYGDGRDFYCADAERKEE